MGSASYDGEMAWCLFKPGTIINDIMAHEDWMPTLLAAAGSPDVKEKLLKGIKVGDKTFKNHLDGYNFLPYFKGQVAEGPRRRVLLLQRQRRSHGTALQRLEDQLQAVKTSFPAR